MILLITNQYESKTSEVLSAVDETSYIVWDNYFQDLDILISSSQYHLIIIMIDGPAGISLCSQIREQCESTPIIWVSDNEVYETIAQSLFIEDFWVKPMPLMLLKKQAHYFLNNKSI